MTKHTIVLLTVLFFFLCQSSVAQRIKSNSVSRGSIDTISIGLRLDSVINVRDSLMIGNISRVKNKVDLSTIVTSPYISIQQYVKGSVPGISVMERSGEPGSELLMFIRGISAPILSHSDVYSLQPTVYINGIPTIQMNPLSYSQQSNDAQPLGPATNLLATIDPNEIEKIEILKDPASLAKLGPNAANGAIWVTTKKATISFRQFSVNSYAGFITKPNVTPINAAYENKFRIPYYEKYSNLAQNYVYPTYLSDSTDLSYYGPANWVDSYYKNRIVHNIDFSFSGGSQRANFRFLFNNSSTPNSADQTKLDKYGAGLFINVIPAKFLSVSSMVYGTRLNRKRNHSLLERFSESRYIPDLANPLPPEKTVYDSYMSDIKSLGVDNNTSNVLTSYIQIGINFSHFRIDSKVTFDYNEGSRDYFVPKSIVEKNNLLSSYYGNNERFAYFNTISYNWKLGYKNKFKIEAGQSFQKDIVKYSYLFSFNTINDFVKVHSAYYDGSGNFIMDGSYDQMRSWPIIDRLRMGLNSIYGALDYSRGDLLDAQFVYRRDGSSTIQPNLRWKDNMVGSAKLHLGNFIKSELVDYLDLRSSYGMILKPFNNDFYSVGPYYTNDVNWGNQTVITTWGGTAVIVRPYRTGFVGYNTPWQYNLNANLGFDFSVFKKRLSGSLDFYSNDSKNGVVPVTISAESGYTQQYKSGMVVNNKGIELALNYKIIENTEKKIFWTFNVNGAYNKNKLKALPGGVKSLIINDSKLEVGKPIDQFFVYENKGIINSTADIPTNGQGAQLTYNGIPFNIGDPIWANTNGDNVIDNNDRVLKGHKMPVVSGGAISSFKYKKFGIDFQFVYAIGNKYLNQDVQRHLDFVSYEGSKSYSSIKEITFWQQVVKTGDYPLYNPWSDVHAYNLYQDLFLKNGSYLKLRSLTFSYDLALYNKGFFKKNGIQTARVYVTGNNIFRVSKDKFDPELADYMGVYSGYGLPLTRSFIAGINFNF